MKWVIVGAGPTGCHIALSLLGRKKVKLEDIVLLDPAPPLSIWERRTQKCGMAYLRSSCVHHIGLDSSDLCRFQKSRFRCAVPWRGKSSSPRLELFNSHCRHLVSGSGLWNRWVEARLEGLEPRGAGFYLKTSSGPLEGDRVVLALGPRWSPSIPEWLTPVRNRVEHLLEPTPTGGFLHSSAGLSIGFLGGGMTSVQAALEWARKGRAALFTRGPLEISEFDVTSGWMGPVPQSFYSLSYRERRCFVDAKRHPGTVNSAVYTELKHALRKGILEHHILISPTAHLMNDGVEVEDGERRFHCHKLCLGTGFTKSLHPLHAHIVESFGAPLSPCGTPLLDRSLQWLPGLYVAGCHADLELGPAAPNILGARLAAERILSCCS